MTTPLLQLRTTTLDTQEGRVHTLDDRTMLHVHRDGVSTETTAGSVLRSLTSSKRTCTIATDLFWVDNAWRQVLVADAWHPDSGWRNVWRRVTA